MRMTRRSFTAQCIAFSALASQGEMLSASQPRVYDLFGVPLRSGSLYPGNENDALAYREAGLLESLKTAGITAADCGDIPIPSFLPHHSIPPIRNWPGPRIVWDCVSDHIASSLKKPGHIPLLIGCDCSIVLGSAQALMNTGSRELHVIYIDGDFDDAPPSAQKVNSAASLATWLLTTPSPFWTGPALKKPQVTVLGWNVPSKSEGDTANSLSLAELRRTGIRRAAELVLNRIPPSADILIHLDIDVLTKQEMPAAYFPHDQGLRLIECEELLRPIAMDPRVRLLEISEYASLRDFERTYLRSLISLLVKILS